MSIPSFSRIVRAGTVALLGSALACAGCGQKEETPAPAPPATAPAGAAGTTGASETPGANGRAIPPAATAAGAKPPSAVAMGQPRASSSPPEAGVPRPAPPAARAEGPRIAFETVRVDLGHMWDVGTRQCRFPFTNTGSEHLVIKAVKASCGCTATSLDRTEFAPGEGSAIEVTFSPKGHGEQSKHIDVVTNATGGAVTRLVVDAEIEPFVTFDPEVVRLDAVALGARHEALITVTSGDPDLVIEAIETTVTSGAPKGSGVHGDYLVARLLDDDPATTSPGSVEPRRQQIEVVLGETAPWGVSYGQLTVASRGTLEGDPVEHSKIINVVATVFGEIHADSTMFALSMLPPGTSFQRTVRLTRPSGGPFEVVSTRVVQSTMPGLSVTARRVADAGVDAWDLVLSGNTGAFVGHAHGVVAIRTNVEGERDLEIRFAGLVREMNK